MTDKARFKPTTWGQMPFSVRKTWLRVNRAFPAYDLKRTRGWEWLTPTADKDRVYATNRSAAWYVAKATPDYFW